MPSMLQVLASKGSRVWSISPDATVFEGLTLMAEKRFDATKIHTHTFPLADLTTALRYARERIEGAIKVVVTNRQANTVANAAAE